MRVSMASLALEPTPQLLEQVRLADRLGFDRFFHNDAKWRREVFARLGAATTVATRLGFGISVLDPYTRHPALAAQAAATLAEMSPGRFTVILGSGSHFDSLPDHDVRKPIAGIREAAELMRRLWAGEQVTMDGAVVRFRAGRLEFEPTAVPEIWIASRGPRILALAGELGDGVLVGSFATATGIEYARSHVARGLERAGRSWEDVELASWLYVSVLDEEDEPVPEDIRMGISHAFWSSRGVLSEMVDDLAADVTDEFRRFVRDAPHEWSDEVLAELRRLIPRGLLDSLAVIGTAEQVAAKLRALEEAGVQHAVLWPFPKQGQTVPDLMTRLADGVLPEIQGAGSGAR